MLVLVRQLCHAGCCSKHGNQASLGRFVFKSAVDTPHIMAGKQQWSSMEAAMCRLYIEQFSADTSTHKQDAQEALAKIIKVALDVSQLTKFTGREKPTVIT